MIVLGLGSNKGDRLANLRSAVAELGGAIKNIQVSPVYESPALLPEGAPAEWNIKYLNMAVRGETELSPQELLVNVKAVERKLGRTPTGHWGPREIDIDILAYDNLVLTEENLQIPHQYLLKRDFALIPFADIAPEWMYPGKGKSYGVTSEKLTHNLIAGLVKTEFKL